MQLVYFIKAEKTGLIKIGTTKSKSSLGKRLSQLTFENADKLTLLLATEALREDDVHREFYKTRHHGEWFTPTPELIALIELHKRPRVDHIGEPAPPIVHYEKSKRPAPKFPVMLPLNNKAANKLIDSLNIRKETL